MPCEDRKFRIHERIFDIQLLQVMVLLGHYLKFRWVKVVTIRFINENRYPNNQYKKIRKTQSLVEDYTITALSHNSTYLDGIERITYS